MNAPQLSSNPARRFLAQWVRLGGFLLLLGAYIAFSQYDHYRSTEANEIERLTTQTAVVSKNIVPLIFSANRAIEGIIEDLPRWQSQVNGAALASRRLSVISDTLPGIRNLLITDANGQVVSSNNPKAKDMVDAFFEEISAALEKGNGVKLSNFGNFDLREKPQRPGRNPKTGEPVPIAARRVVAFHASAKLKAAVESTPRQ